MLLKWSTGRCSSSTAFIGFIFPIHSSQPNGLSCCFALKEKKRKFLWTVLLLSCCQCFTAREIRRLPRRTIGYQCLHVCILYGHIPITVLLFLRCFFVRSKKVYMDNTICKYSPCDIVLLTENIKYPMDKCRLLSIGPTNCTQLPVGANFPEATAG